MASPSNINLSDKPHDQSQQATPDTPPTTFEAATAALDTNELLHLIIAEVPREDRTSLRRVSKTWQAAIEKLGHALDPVEDGFDGFRQRPELPVYYLFGETMYERGKHLKCNESNPVIDCWTENVKFACVQSNCNCDDFSGMKADIFFDPDRVSGTPESLKRENEFITDPPITQVHVTAKVIDAFDRSSRQRIALRMRGGIRVRDLRECFEGMKGDEDMYTRVVHFGMLGQESDDDGESGSWYVDDSSELRGDGTPYDYGRESDDKGEGYDSEQREGYLDNLGNGYTEDGHEWDHRGPPEAWSDRSKGDDNESGEGGWANDEAKDGYEWSFENELEKWSNGSQGDDSEPREGGLTSDEPQDDYELTFENELEKWSNGSQGEDLRQ